MTVHSGRSQLRTNAWLLRGISSLPGVLVLANGRLSFNASSSGSMWPGQLRRLQRETGRAELPALLEDGRSAIVFDVPVAELEDVHFPWYYFTGGIKLSVNGVRYRFSFARPANTRTHPDVLDSIHDVGSARRSGVSWKAVLLDNKGRLPL
jgi:hypothetical protein